MAKYSSYEVVHVRSRDDGRVEPAGRERLVLSREEAMELSYTAIVVSLAEGFGGKPVYIFEGRHAQFDGHLGWVS